MKWEYKILNWPDAFNVASRDPVQSKLQEILKEAGLERWELVTLKNQYMIFKRELEESKLHATGAKATDNGFEVGHGLFARRRPRR